ncbi:hypothetical protein [Anaerocolumna xylanovorans]|uniref:Uncharacterized protein n=1 Tax=Anaerocolumna xylanovorans DSM 12503 TaxID=1121345 RepID=A0A1M7XW78_9FIRM|nr:hypothetical protein [Anaerocolumna xylanovorans]SHO42968.1 hypothetical protein SAMN02745217_00042 [Anaerocolumna xylanovorans DSM 12503]
MKHRLSNIREILAVIVVTGIITVVPYIYFQLQEGHLLGMKPEIPVDTVEIQKSNAEQLNLEQRRDMIRTGEADVERISLKTGNAYSLYEARKQCYRELCKIPALKMDIDGPVQREIDISPQLLVNAKVPSYSMIIWSGSLEIKDIPYKIVLDEDSGKLLSIQIADENIKEYEKLQEVFEKELEEYFYQ